MSLPLTMQLSGDDHRRAPHVVLHPSAGMGHLTPFMRLAVLLSTRGCDVSLVATHPMVSSAESRHISHFFAAFPRIRPLELHLPQLDPSEFASPDPFILRFEAIRRSAHLLPLLFVDFSPPVSAVIVDISVASTYVPAVAAAGFPCYVYSPSCAAMLSLCAYFPTYMARKTTDGVGDVDIPGVGRVPRSSLPVPLRDPNNLFTRQFVESGQTFPKADGILLNTFQALEPAALAALNGGKVVPGLPPVFAIGPLQPLGLASQAQLAWLDEQPERSVVYVNFGSRSAMSTEQIKELGSGLERSGCRFLWVVRSKVVDKEEEEVGLDLEQVLGDGYAERVKERGVVMKSWVEQEEILRHSAVGGFVSHCGWNSVVEAAMYGVRILGWAWMGDQRVNAGVVARSGLGIFVEKWKWESEEVVKGEEICERLRELMAGDEGLRASTERVREEAVAAVDVGTAGSSYAALMEFIRRLKV